MTALAMVGRVLGFALLVACGLGLPGLARAQSGFPAAFVVADIPADATGKDGVAAREAARTQGEMIAFKQLLQRLTQPADWPRLPQLDAGAVTDLLVDFQVANEHASASRYIANFTFRFNPKSVRALLDNAGIAYSELGSKPVVIVPVLDEGDETHLWDDPNPWREAWNAVPGRSGIVPFVVPAGDLGDLAALDHSDADHPKPEQVQALSQRYDDGDVVIARAKLGQQPDGGAHLDITVSRYRADGNAEAATAAVDGAKADSSLYLAGVQAAVKQLEDAWKKVVPMAGSTDQRVIEVSVAIAGPGDWPKIRARLGSVPMVKSVEVEMMTRREVRVLLTVAADPATLRLALAQQDLGFAETQPLATMNLKPRPDAPVPAPAPEPHPT
jgi:hypothetical protein